MPHTDVVMRVRFESDLTLEQVAGVVEQRAHEFEALAGLRQKYYLQDVESGAYAGLYVWESLEALEKFRASELRATIAEAYQSRNEPDIEIYRVFKVLRENA